MRCVTFEQIVDSRNENYDKTVLADRLARILLLRKGKYIIVAEKVRFLDFGDCTQYRQRYYVKRLIRNWQELYRIVNSVCAVPYDFVHINDAVFEQ